MGFQVPAFFMPFEAKVNPHLDACRPRVRAWAQSVGLLEPQHVASRHGGWNVDVFERADFTYFTALTYPHACAEELELLAGWHTLIWCLDDVFLPLCEELGDRTQILGRVAALIDLLPITEIDRGPLNAGRALENALADLWRRTAPSASRYWRLLFIRSIQQFLDASLWEADNLTRHRHPDLIEQIEMRRDYGAAGCSALLMEHSFGWEVPPAIRAKRAFSVLIDAFRDTVDLHNDIVSYPKEVKEGVAENNIIQIVRSLHGLSLAEAVALVNTMLTARVRTLEQTVTTDLPQALHDMHVDSDTEEAVLRHARAIQGWAAGSYQWHKDTGRYVG